MGESHHHRHYATLHVHTDDKIVFLSLPSRIELVSCFRRLALFPRALPILFIVFSAPPPGGVQCKRLYVVFGDGGGGGVGSLYEGCLVLLSSPEGRSRAAVSYDSLYIYKCGGYMDVVLLYYYYIARGRSRRITLIA